MKKPPRQTPLMQGPLLYFRPSAGHQKGQGSKRRGARAIGRAIAGPSLWGDFPDSTFDLSLRLWFVSKETHLIRSLLRSAVNRSVNRRHQIEYLDGLEQVDISA